jgi:DNA-binding transcriptional LysR family regulator
MPDRRAALTPDALAMVDAIARTGSFAAAARELGKVPSALTYSVRQLEDALDVLLFDRRSRTAQLTAAGHELLHEGRRLLHELDAVANRVRRVASGWEARLAIAVEDIVCSATLFELVEAFCALRPGGGDEPPPTRLALSTGVLSGTWEALLSGQADLAIGLAGDPPAGTDGRNAGGLELRPLGEVPFVFCVAPHHPLAAEAEPLDDARLVHHRAVAVADTALRFMRQTVNLLPGQDVLTVPSSHAKLEAQLRGLACGFLPEPLARPHLESGRLVPRRTVRGAHVAVLQYGWRAERGAGPGAAAGPALAWWIAQLGRPVTRRSLVERHGPPVG